MKTKQVADRDFETYSNLHLLAIAIWGSLLATWTWAINNKKTVAKYLSIIVGVYLAFGFYRLYVVTKDVSGVKFDYTPWVDWWWVKLFS